jgi:hypothetical protein
MGDVDNPSSLVPLSDIQKWVKQALEERQITNFEIRVKGAAQKGDGLLCNITFVEVTSKTISDKSVLYNFAIKSSKKNKKLREKIPLGVLGVNELRLHAFQPSRVIENWGCFRPPPVLLLQLLRPPKRRDHHHARLEGGRLLHARPQAPDEYGPGEACGEDVHTVSRTVLRHPRHETRQLPRTDPPPEEHFEVDRDVASAQRRKVFRRSAQACAGEE